MTTSALVLFSGGQDSTTCLAWALERYDAVHTVAFDYGQRHRIELDCRALILQRMPALKPQWANKLGTDQLIDLSVLGQISETALTRDTQIQFEKTGLPNTFVPGRNLIFLTFAAAIAYRLGVNALVGGMCETDFSGYPDCRDATLRSLQTSVNLGMDAHFTIETPLMWLTKQRTWTLANELGGDALVELIREHTHTCYLGERGQRHDWGYGCGQCPACELRAQGWSAYAAQ